MSASREGDAVFSAARGLRARRVPRRRAVGGDAELDELTPREREVLQLIARGYVYKEIAARLSLSVKTVESHVSSVLRKLQLSTRHELTRWARSAGSSNGAENLFGLEMRFV